MRFALAVLMALHGIAHLPGFLVPWKLLRSPDMPYATTVLAGRVDLGGAGIRAMGVLWLLTGLAFVVAAVQTWTGASGWTPFAVSVAGVSLLLSVLAWPLSRVGVIVNAVVLAWVVLVAWWAPLAASGPVGS